jgi:hypothetical protein
MATTSWLNLGGTWSLIWMKHKQRTSSLTIHRSTESLHSKVKPTFTLKQGIYSSDMDTSRLEMKLIHSMDQSRLHFTERRTLNIWLSIMLLKRVIKSLQT